MTATLPTIETPGGQPIMALPIITVDESGNYAGGGGGGGGSGNATYADISIASLTGSSEQLAAANTNRKVLFITNIGTAVVNVNLTGGNAAAGAGSFPILAGGSALFDTNVPTNQINIIGTAGQPVTAYEG